MKKTILSTALAFAFLVGTGNANAELLSRKKHYTAYQSEAAKQTVGKAKTRTSENSNLLSQEIVNVMQSFRRVLGYIRETENAANTGKTAYEQRLLLESFCGVAENLAEKIEQHDNIGLIKQAYVDNIKQKCNQLISGPNASETQQVFAGITPEKMKIIAEKLRIFIYKHAGGDVQKNIEDCIKAVENLFRYSMPTDEFHAITLAYCTKMVALFRMAIPQQNVVDDIDSMVQMATTTE